MSHPTFDIEIHRTGRDVRVALRGEFDLATAPALERALDELSRQQGIRLVLDLRELLFMDSTGLRLLVQADALARQNGYDLLIVQGPPPIARLLEISGLLDQLPLIDEPPDGS